MAVSLDGSTQWVSLADRSDIVRVRPFSMAALVKRPDTVDGGVFYQQGNWSHGWNLGFDAGATGKYTFELNSNDYQSTFSPPGGVWFLCGASIIDAGASSTIYFWQYNYSTSTFSNNTVTGAVDQDATALAAGEHVSIGTWYDDGGYRQSYYKGQIGYIALFDFDITGGGAPSTSRYVNELVSNGPWNLLDSHVKFFMPFHAAARDLSGGGKHGTLQGSPGYVGGYVGENPTWSVIPETHPGGGAVNVTVLPGLLSLAPSLLGETVTGDSNVSPNLLSVPITVLGETVTGDSNYAPNHLDLSVGELDPIITGQANVSPGLLTVPVLPRAPGVAGDANVVSGSLPIAVSLGDPSVSGSAGVLPGILTLSPSVRSPSITGDANLALNTLTLPIVQYSANISGSANVAPGILAIGTGLGDPGFSTDQILAQNYLSALLELKDPAVQAGATITLNAQTVTVTARSVQVLFDCTVTPLVLSLSTSILPVTVQTGGNVTVPMNVLTLGVALRDPGVSGDANLSLGLLGIGSSILGESVSGGATVQANVLSSSATVRGTTASGGATVPLSSLSVHFSLQDPTVIVITDVTVPLGTLTLGVSVRGVSIALPAFKPKGSVVLEPYYSGNVTVPLLPVGHVTIEPWFKGLVTFQVQATGRVILVPSPTGQVSLEPTPRGSVILEPYFRGVVTLEPNPKGVVTLDNI